MVHQESAKIENVFKMTDKMVNWNPVRKQALGIHKKSGSERIIIQRRVEREQREEFRRRFEAVNRFNHRHVQEYYELFEDSKNVYIVAEPLKGAELITEFSENRRITEGKCASIIYQILEAITYLHSKGLAHNNISGQSVQFVAEGSDQVKLVDLDEVSNGISDFNSYIDRASKTNSDAYVAPELLKGVWSIKNDEWSVGVLLHQLLIG